MCIWHVRCDAWRMPTPNVPPLVPPGEPEPLVCDTSRRFVRVTEERPDGLVAFEFSIGWPELSVELLLPRAAFDEFCTRNQVVRLEPRAEDRTPVDDEEEMDE